MKFIVEGGKSVSCNLSFVEDENFKSDLEVQTYKFLRGRFPYCKIVYELKVPYTKMSIDFFVPQRMIAIECDGIHHAKYNKFFHGSYKNFVAQKQRDNKKSWFCELNNIKLIRITTIEELFKLYGN